MDGISNKFSSLLRRKQAPTQADPSNPNGAAGKTPAFSEATVTYDHVRVGDMIIQVAKGEATNLLQYFGSAGMTGRLCFYAKGGNEPVGIVYFRGGAGLLRPLHGAQRHRGGGLDVSPAERGGSRFHQERGVG